MDSAYYPFLLAIGIALVGFLVWYVKSGISSSGFSRDYPQQLSMDLKMVDDLAVLTAVGRLEMSQTHLLRREIERLLAQDLRRIVLDFSSAILDEAAMGELVSNYSQVRSDGGEMAIVRGEASQVLEDISMGGLAPSLHDSLDEAVRHLRNW